MKKTVCIGMAFCILFSLCSCKKNPDNILNETPGDDLSFISVMLGGKNIFITAASSKTFSCIFAVSIPCFC